MTTERNPFLPGIPPVTKNLLLINLVVWLTDATLEHTAGIHLSNILGLHYIFNGFSIWQPFTYMFMHANFSHIFFNMFAVWMFGAPLEQRWGSKRYLTYYLITGVGAGLIQELVWFFMYGTVPAAAVVIGASGAVFSILLAFGWLFPDVRIFIFPIPIPVRARILVIIYAVVELFEGIAGADNIAHFAHLGGMIFGLGLILWWKHKGVSSMSSESNGEPSRLQQWWQQRKRKQREEKKPHYSDYHYQEPVRDEQPQEEKSRKEAELKKEIDRILDKIKLSGYDSLTAEEKRKLFEQQ